MNFTKEMILDLLQGVIDPEVGLNIVDMGLVYGVEFPKNDVIEVRMTLTTRGCPMGSYMTGEVQRTLEALSGVREVRVEIVWEPQWSPSRIKPDALETLQNRNNS